MRGTVPVRYDPEVQKQAATATGSEKFPDGGDPHVLRFWQAHPGEYDSDVAAGTDNGEGTHTG